ncbi:MAG: glycosyltransferase [Prosthecobacter sp.]|uniref:glycosyltransferase n=1 Tax=Prosthecobacter sp. TaxID=1965333 RepID=UPI0025F68DB6|nr:nucleotide disphospho-sugar-binding domain-containing protein [Prosthecobacter sp.]MCF7786125.1 glycosyltransferase [Prosthecobacter sp.]
MSHVLLLPFGTSGSVFPFIWLGRLLKRRGHRVTMITARIHEKRVISAGLNFVAVGNDATEQMLQDPNLWRPGHGSKVAYQHAGHATCDYVEAVESIIAREGMPDLMLAPMICFGARLLREKRRLPLVSVHLYPMMFVSPHDVPLVIPAFRWLRILPIWLRKAVLAFPNPLDFFALFAVRRCCAKNGVTKPWSLWRQWWHSPDGVLVLFPAWFAAPQPDWPQNLLQWDFPLEDMAAEHPLDPELKAFLDAGEPPVVFTPGTGHHHAQRFFETAVSLTEKLGCRAVFLTLKTAQVPADLPPSIFVAAYAPFSALLPHASAFVHHGGIGTIAQSLAAGVPQLVVDMALDQHDNAERLERLGVGLSIRSSRFSPEQALPLLQRCLSDQQMRQNAKQMMARTGATRDIGTLLAWLEEKITPGSEKPKLHE